MPELVEQINNEYQFVSVSNNAIWAAGEIALRWGKEIEPYVERLYARLLPMLVNMPVQDSLQVNAVITIGRLGCACPALLAGRLPQFIKPWLQKSDAIRENDEMDTAFQGLCEIIKLNPQGIGDVSIFFC